MQKERLKLGLIFNFNPVWMGGIIYLLNSIRIFKFLKDEDKPKIYVFYNPVLKKFVDEIDYPYAEFIPRQFPSVYKGYILSWIKRKNIFVDDLVTDYNLDAVFPMHDYPLKSKSKAKLVSWYADLQHMQYPEFWSKKIRMGRSARIRYILKNSKDLVLSSNAVKDDFYKFFKMPKDLNIHIYHFVSIIEGLPDISIEALREKYGLKENYFMISNQFHKHKNHKVVFEAVSKLKKKGVYVNVAITGRFPVNPDSPYLKDLHNIVNENQLKDQIAFLGLIPRGDQLLLMKHAQAIIQPSLFEGWSTVIEDARSLQVPVIAANLPVNIEQLEEKGTYFQPHDVDTLAELLESAPERDYSKDLYEPYELRMKAAAYELLNVFKN